MRKIIFYVMGIVLFCFVIPIMFTEPFKASQVSSLTNIENNSIDISSETAQNRIDTPKAYSKNENIKILFASDNVIKEMKIDDYLYGVVAAEMPASYNIEALKAQAVVARTYTLYSIENNTDKHGEASVCTDSKCCQAWISKEDRIAKWSEINRDEYWNKIVTAVDSTKGQVIKYQGKLINAFFHANSGGKTEAPINVWGGSGYPYLQTVATSGEDAYSQYKSEAEFTFDELLKKIKEKYSDIVLDFNKDDAIKILERFDSGRIKTIRFGNKDFSGVEVRTLLELKSANFDIEIKDNKIKFTVYGYGHGVGMSQTGADSLANQGQKYEDIIKHFYTGVNIENY